MDKRQRTVIHLSCVITRTMIDMLPSLSSCLVISGLPLSPSCSEDFGAVTFSEMHSIYNINVCENGSGDVIYVDVIRY